MIGMNPLWYEQVPPSRTHPLVPLSPSFKACNKLLMPLPLVLPPYPLESPSPPPPQVRENQAVGNELASASQQRDHALDELRRLSSRLGGAEQLVRAKEAEVEDLRCAYEALALEHRR